MSQVDPLVVVPEGPGWVGDDHPENDEWATPTDASVVLYDDRTTDEESRFTMASLAIKTDEPYPADEVGVELTRADCVNLAADLLRLAGYKVVINHRGRNPMRDTLQPRLKDFDEEKGVRFDAYYITCGICRFSFAHGEEPSDFDAYEKASNLCDDHLAVYRLGK